VQVEPSGVHGQLAPEHVSEHAHDFFEQARALLGDRFAEARFDLDDRGLRVTIVDPTDQDVTVIGDVARGLGIESWVRLERADPVAVAAWERLSHDLQRLGAADPRLLLRYPGPSARYRRPPVEIHLISTAESTAAELHEGYGDFVSLRVGALPYPPAAAPETPRRTVDRDPVDPAEFRIELESPLSLTRGSRTTHGLLLTNLGNQDIGVHTNGQLTAAIVDGDRIVGGLDTGGVWNQPRLTFAAAPSETVRMPVIVGTTSYAPELGYVLPAGNWHLTARLDLADGRRLRTPALPLTITR